MALDIGTNIHYQDIEMAWIPTELTDVETRLKNDESPTTTVRKFLWWFGYERRGWRVVRQIRQALNSIDLITTPDFEYQWIDGAITFTKKPLPPAQGQGTGTTQSPSVLNEEISVEVEPVTVVGGAVEDPTYRIGKLDAANKPPLNIRPDASLSEAVTIMLREDFSQLPVMTSERDVKGIVTWRTIASRLSLGKSCQTIRDCMDKNVEIVDSDVSLFRVIDLIADQDFVLVRDKERKISGIVTASDLGQSFHQLGYPFLLLSEIENHIRGIIDGKFTLDEIQEVRNPNDSERKISDVSDLTFGEYVRLLQNPDKWKKVAINIDRATFVKDLERVNSIRNDVMHFDPDGIGPDDLEELKKTAKFVQELRAISGSNDT